MAAGSNVELSLISVANTQVSIAATIFSGSSESGQIVYFVNNVEVARGSTISIAGGTSTSDTMTGLTSGTEYTAKFYSQTEGGYSQSTLTFTTLSDKKLYGSANSQSQLVNTLYGGNAGVARKINKLYGSVNGETKLIHQDFSHCPYSLCHIQIVGDDICYAPDLEAFSNKFMAQYPNETLLTSYVFMIRKYWLEISGVGEYRYYYTIYGVDQLGEMQVHPIVIFDTYSELVNGVTAWGITLKPTILENAEMVANGQIVC